MQFSKDHGGGGVWHGLNHLIRDDAQHQMQRGSASILEALVVSMMLGRLGPMGPI